jgi:hypothetical protein
MKRKKQTSKTIVSLAAIVVLTSGGAHAAITALLTAPGSGTLRNNFSGSVGSTFTSISASTVINRLGFYDAGGDGLAAAHTVGLYLWDGSAYQLQTSATISAGTGATLDGGYRWVSIADYTLSNLNSQYYLVMATMTNADGDAWGDVQTFPTNPIGTMDARGWWSTGGITATFTPNLVGNGYAGLGDVYYAGNLGYIPEPSTALLGGLGMLALLRRRR